MNNKELKQKLNDDRILLKKYTRSMWWVTVTVLAVWVGALILGSLIMTWAEGITDGEDSYNFLVALAFVCLSLVIAVPGTILVTNRISKAIAYVNYHLKKVANGDFNTKLETQSKNVYINDLVNNFNIMVDQLNSVAIMKNDFVSTFSHEFKTPMMSVKGYAELLCESENLNADEREYAKIILSESERLFNLSEKVMMLSKLDSQVIVSDKKEFYIDGQIEKCILLLDGVLKEKNIDIDVDLKRVKTVGDAELVNEIWINILGNAVKYTQNGGKISVTCVKKDGQAVVTVKDNGIGMSEETLSRVFEKFYQADSKHSRGGLGLGLTLCKKIAEMFGGKIVCESELKKGTTVTVTLPSN